MTRSCVVVDTNVPIVANGRGNGNQPSPACQLATIQCLEGILSGKMILLDFAGDIQAEYRRYLNPRGQPGVGDRFYQAVLNCQVESVMRIDLEKRPDGSFSQFPQDHDLQNFDPSDRKFAALARQQHAPVINATDSDWLDHRAALERNGIQVEFVCGCDSATWFQPKPCQQALPS
jgi:hypothetical protein